MATNETLVQDLKINILSKDQYDSAEKNTDEFYLVTDDILNIEEGGTGGSDATTARQNLDAMCATNPVGTGSFSMNRLSDTAIGNYSHAEGFRTTASQQSSHAEGTYTIASALNAHAEGNNTEASGEDSHAEGNNTEASRWASHAEGINTEARGDASHAEGSFTKALGENSHAEGYHTIAYDNSHVSGKFNIEDTENTYAEIIGNGESSDARSNARTLDWDGNEFLQGQLTTSGVNIGNAMLSYDSNLSALKIQFLE